VYYKWEAYYPLTVLNKIYTKSKVLLSFARAAVIDFVKSLLII